MGFLLSWIRLIHLIFWLFHLKKTKITLGSTNNIMFVRYLLFYSLGRVQKSVRSRIIIFFFFLMYAFREVIFLESNVNFVHFPSFSFTSMARNYLQDTDIGTSTLDIVQNDSVVLSFVKLVGNAIYFGCIESKVYQRIHSPRSQ